MRFHSLLALAVLILLSRCSFVDAATFTRLGDLPEGSFDSDPLGLSAMGGVVVGDSNSPSGFEATRWTLSGRMVGVGDLPGSSFDTLAKSWE